MKVFILTVVVTFQVCQSQGQVWATWNNNKNIRYGFLNQSLPHQKAQEACQLENFHSLVTIRNRQEHEDVEKVIRDYKHETQQQNSNSLFTTYYWLGIMESNSNSNASVFPTNWVYFDGLETSFTEWDDAFPKSLSGLSCAVAKRQCASICVLKWQNRLCTNFRHIDGIICEIRENRTSLKEIEENINETISLSGVFDANTTESFVADVYAASSQLNLNQNEVERGIRILSILAKQDDVEVNEETIKDLLETIQIYEDFAGDNIANLSVFHREMAVLSTERFLNRLNISRNKVIAKFNTSTITAEVRYVNTATATEDQVYTTLGPRSANIVVSREAMQQVGNTVGTGNKSRLSFIRYSRSTFFPSSYNVSQSQVISAQINGQNVRGLKTPITFSIPLDPSNVEDIAFVQCVSWNFSISSWSNQGCWLVSRDNSPVCACNHLTNFALLVELFRRPVYVLFNIVNKYIGALSCAGFFLVAIIYMCYKELRTSKPGPVHINLCVCYGFGYLIFLTGSEKREEEATCLTITILTHYFFLAGWFWTLIEAITMYQLLVIKRKYLNNHYHLYAFAAAYFIPFIIVAANVGVTVGYLDRIPTNGFYRLNGSLLAFNSNYVSDVSCWLTSYSLYFGFLVIGGILFGMNIVIYIIVLRSITWNRKKIKSNRKDTSAIEIFYRVVTIGMLLGLIWLLAIPMELLAATKILMEPVTYIFSILIALQGIIIFYLFCVRHVKARQLWWDPVWKMLRRLFSHKWRKRAQFRHLTATKSYDFRQKRKGYNDSCIGSITKSASGMYSQSVKYTNYSFINR